jgi:dTDP-4-dehydrorhamnose reductase
MQRVLVTGSNGLLGQKLVSLLQQDPALHLIATARGALIPSLTVGEFHVLDITNETQLKQVVAQTKPSVVINTAAMTHVDQCEQDREGCYMQNVRAVENLVNVCTESNIHLIHLSTDFIFDGSTGPLSESATPNPVNFYGECKLAAERLIQDSALSWCILRTVLVYGITPDMSRSNIVLWVKNSLEQGKPIRVVNDQWRTPTLAEDLAQGCYLAAKATAKGVFHISGSEMMTPYDIAMKTAHYFKLDTSLISATDSNEFKQPALRPLKTGFVIDKAIRELKYKPHTFQEGLAIVASQLR